MLMRKRSEHRNSRELSLLSVSDPYLIPGTSTLKNLLGIEDPAELAKVEFDRSAFRALGLIKKIYTEGPKAFDKNLLQSTHHALFKDVYGWAGTFRVSNISKGSSVFANTTRLDPECDKLFAALNKDLMTLSSGSKPPAKDAFVNASAKFLGEVNSLHPFREGNGRTQRMVIRMAGAALGFHLDWSRASPKQMINASIYSHNVDDSLLVELLHKSTTQSKQPALGLVMAPDRAPAKDRGRERER